MDRGLDENSYSVRVIFHYPQQPGGVERFAALPGLEAIATHLVGWRELGIEKKLGCRIVMDISPAFSGIFFLLSIRDHI